VASKDAGKEANGDSLGSDAPSQRAGASIGRTAPIQIKCGSSDESMLPVSADTP
jgi:hypothetical protein